MNDMVNSMNIPDTQSVNDGVTPCTRYFQESRHVEDISCSVQSKGSASQQESWSRYGKERQRTVSVALVMCLHLGVDPPDVQKPNPCARLEAWIDPTTMNLTKAANQIAASLQRSYERWQPRARYKTSIDPTMDDVRKLCLSMRRNAKEDRVLFHYNGHGVPKPTSNGEIWVFNKSFTQYIPLSVFDLQAWMDSPSIYVWDCPSAETIVNAFLRFADDHETEWSTDFSTHMESEVAGRLPPISSDMTEEEQAIAVGFRRKPRLAQDCIQLAACRTNERLPTDPDLPADLFTSCLTTPIHTSIVWYLHKTGRKTEFPEKLLDNIPGQLTDRRTMLGELHWIFTAIADTIAWNSVEKSLFQRLFRQDLLVASMFRSFLLAEKIMGYMGCRVVSSPALPSMSDHPLWASWEYTLDQTLNHIHNLTIPKADFFFVGRDLFFSKSRLIVLNPLIDLSGIIGEAGEAVQHNWFFVEQLQAFEIWLKYGTDHHQPPQQLPIVLQVLLSQAHRLRALELLARFLDMGQWAIGHALTVGVYPYVQKLLQSNTKELRTYLAFIWAKIMAVDPSCQAELMKENGGDEAPTPRIQKGYEAKKLRYLYFMKNICDDDARPREKVVSAFVLAKLTHGNYRPAQEQLTNDEYVNMVTEKIMEESVRDCRLLKLWLLIGIAKMWVDYDPARWQAARQDAHPKILHELNDPAPEVRAAAVYALGCLFQNRSEDNEHARTIDQQACDTLCEKCAFDGSELVRVELVVALQWYILDFEKYFAKTLLSIRVRMTEDRKKLVTAVRRKETVDMDHMKNRLTQPPMRKFSMPMPAPTRQKCNSESGAEEGFDPLRLTESPGVENYFQIRNELRDHLDYLESMTFVQPMERTWMTLLRLALDPCNKVSTMARKIVSYITQLADDVDNQTMQKIHSQAISLRLSESSTDMTDAAPLDSAHPARDTAKAIDSAKGFRSGSPHHEVARSLDDDRNGNGVMFVVGSPLIHPPSFENHSRSPIATTPLFKLSLNAMQAPAISGSSAGQGENSRFTVSTTPTNQTSQSNFATPQTNTKARDQDRKMALKNVLTKSTFTPKRDQRQGVFSKSTGSNAPTSRMSLVKSDLVEWCSQIFLQPVLDYILRDEDVDGQVDSLLTQVNPTDWAYHTQQGQKQQADKEFDALKGVGCETLLSMRMEGRPIAADFSMLRKVVYATDGTSVHVLRYDKTSSRVSRSMRIHGPSNHMNTDRSHYISVINALSNEMLLLASDAGIIRIWDPGYCIHSHEWEREAHLVTTSLPLGDQIRKPVDPDNRDKRVLWDWSQSTGRLVCGGNMRVIRIWDAHYEKTVTNIPVGARLGAVTSLSADMEENAQLVVVGYRTGVVQMLDIRMPSTTPAITLCDYSTKVAGVAIPKDSAQPVLVSATADGIVNVWEPRNFMEPIVEMNVCSPGSVLTSMKCHENAQMFAVTTLVPDKHSGTPGNQMKLFDISGRQVNASKPPEEKKPYNCGNVTALGMHQIRCLVALCSDDGSVHVYGQQKTSL